MKWPLRRVASAIVLTIGLLAAGVSAQDKAATSPNDNNASSGSYRYFSQDAPPIDAQLYASAAARAEHTRVQLSQAESRVSALPVIMRASFEDSAEYRKALSDLKEAYEGYHMLRARAIAGVAQTDADYKAAVAEQDRIARILAAGNLSAKEKLDLAAKKMAYGSTASRILAEALDADPKVKDARARMLAAANRERNLRLDFEAAARKDPTFIAAIKDMRNARVNAAAASAYYYALDRAYGQMFDFYYYKERDRYGISYYGNGYYNPYSNTPYCAPANYTYYRY